MPEERVDEIAMGTMNGDASKPTAFAFTALRTKPSMTSATSSSVIGRVGFATRSK
jgi:hypothetical protein